MSSPRRRGSRRCRAFARTTLDSRFRGNDIEGNSKILGNRRLLGLGGGDCEAMKGSKWRSRSR
ncbi:hypothetical protein D3876_08730 [Sphingomonas cavernae]|uniref:Uncharacterized protein n=1 Tax=Sphingomonas cavernae TaxID=2320861 RepID=A0A418WK68_9SPHN|nr:hypothetical protein D3876_08730 [Sphingomonas cavernae]